MEVEDRIARAHIRVVARIPPDGVVPARMQSAGQLEERFEGLEVVVAGHERDDIGRLQVVGVEQRDVALQAAGVVVQAAAVADRGPVGRRAEIEDVVGEGTGVDAAATRSGREGEVQAEGADVYGGVRNAFAVAAHGVDGAVEDFGFPRIMVGERPVPVGCRAGVAAFGAKQFVVDVGKVAVPVEEGALSILVGHFFLGTFRGKKLNIHNYGRKGPGRYALQSHRRSGYERPVL